MIPSVPASPLPAIATPGQPGEAVVAAGGEPTEMLDFAALLAVEGAGAEALAAQAEAAPSPLPAGHVLVTAAASTGKILPPALPEEGADDPRSETTDQSEPAASEPVPAPPVADILPLPAQPQAEAGPATQPAAGAQPPRSLPAAAAQSAVAAMLRRPEATTPAQPHPGDLPRTGLPEADASIPALAATADAVVRKVIKTPVPAEEVRLDLTRLASALPRGELRLPTEIVQSNGDMAAGPTEGLAATAQPAPSGPATLGSSPGVQQIIRPQDFSALIDRLTAAREALVPQSVAITVAHQDFGPVRLRFRSEENGLSVAMASADPGFARAAATAPLPFLASTGSDQAGFTPQRGDSGQAQPGSSGSSGRGATPDRREGQPQSGHAPARDRSADRSETRRDIFA